MKELQRSVSIQAVEVLGANLLSTIEKRITAHLAEAETCETKIASIITAINDVDVVKRCIRLIVQLQYNQFLNGDALTIKGLVERAAYLQREVLELRCYLRLIDPGTLYSIQLSDALRFGIV